MARKFDQIISRGDRGWLIGGRGKRIPEVLWYRLHESGIGNSACVHRWSDMAVLGSAWVTGLPDGKRNLLSVSGWPTIQQRQEHSWFSMEHPNSNVGPSCQIPPKR